jgi:hypothetical protein
MVNCGGTEAHSDHSLEQWGWVWSWRAGLRKRPESFGGVKEPRGGMLSRLSIVGVCRQKRLAAKAWHPANFVAHQTSNFSRLPRKRFRHPFPAAIMVSPTKRFQTLGPLISHLLRMNPSACPIMVKPQELRDPAPVGRDGARSQSPYFARGFILLKELHSLQSPAQESLGHFARPNSPQLVE